MLKLYRALTFLGTPALHLLLSMREKRGKEDKTRLYERKGLSSIHRPDGLLIWVHAASVGEAQSALILIESLLGQYQGLNVLLTSGTRTSAAFMAEKLPKGAVHQYMPIDHPVWVSRFLDHWKPDLALWMESELWPNMLSEIKQRSIPAALLNARLSDTSFKRWMKWKKPAADLLGTFNLILAQTAKDEEHFKNLNAQNVYMPGNLKYSATPLRYDEDALKTLSEAIKDRPTWVFASTHKGEEEMAVRIHRRLKPDISGLLTIIVPRHPERAERILKSIGSDGLSTQQRSQSKSIASETDIYLADTMGELGLFYRLCDIALIGRSFSDDGGGGHNPIEAAQLDCAVLYGPKVQFQREIYADMKAANAALQISDEKMLAEKLQTLLTSPKDCQTLQNQARKFANQKSAVIDDVMALLTPLLNQSGFDLGEKVKKAL